MHDTAQLQTRWKNLYQDQLPALAKARDPVQKSWPVYLDHCFARIVLDNAIGIDRPWTGIIKQPAVKNMNSEQLIDAIELAEKVATGQADIEALNARSLEVRGKKRKAAAVRDESPRAKKQQRSTETISSYFLPSPTSPQQAPGSTTNAKDGGDATNEDEPKGESDNVNIPVQLKRIADSNITPFRKRMLTLLCQIPRGRYSTYQAMSDHVTRTSHKTCARAVGNAMRNNPFAPEVPCHRVLANDGSLGGFNGHWGENGKFANQKHQLLHEEGVRFDSKGKVKGPPFRDFTA